MATEKPKDDADDNWLEAALENAKDAEKRPPREPRGLDLSEGRKCAERLAREIAELLRSAQPKHYRKDRPDSKG